MVRVLFVGNSHLVALLQAAREASGEPPAPAETSFLWASNEVQVHRVAVGRRDDRVHLSFVLLDGASWLRFATGSVDHPTVSPTYAAPIRELVGEEGVDRVVSCLYGNEQAVFSLLEHEVPFDFAYDGDDVITDGNARQILPAAVVRRELEGRLAPLVRSCRALRDLVPDVPMAHLMSPPPVASSELIRERPEALASAIDARGVAPGALRLKVYRLARRIVADALADVDIEVLSAPPDALHEGFLAEACWMASVHANATYGGLVLDQLGAR